MINNRQGQAMVEIFLACVVGIVAFAGVLTAIYWISLRAYSSYYLYEGVICNVHSSKNTCEQKTKQYMSKFPLVRAAEVKFNKRVSRKSYQINGELIVKNSFCKNCRILQIKESAYVPKTYR